MPGRTYFAIGDIHGEAKKLASLHAMILDRIALERPAGQPATIIHLGDYVDRGPDTRGVIDQIMALEQSLARHPSVETKSLMGNHEQILLDDYDRDDGPVSLTWAKAGARETLQSYDSDASLHDLDWRRHIPAAHIDWLRRLPSLIYDDDRKLAFVHAGIEPAEFPDCREEVRLWTRSKSFMEPARWPPRAVLQDLVVVHGHTPVSFEPELLAQRINVDTGACYGGPLTAVMLKAGEKPQFLHAG
jgi:serine/threonine protein phosphatase 1